MRLRLAIGGVADPEARACDGGHTPKERPHDHDLREHHREARCRAPYDRCHPAGGAARHAAQPVHAVARRQPADHRDRRRCPRGGLRRRRPLGDHRAADRQPARRHRDGAALGPGAATRPAADDLEPRAVRHLRRDRPAGPGDRDVPRLHRDRHGARRPGDQRAPEGRQRLDRHRALRGDRRRDRDRRLPLDPRGRPHRQRARHHRAGLPRDPAGPPARRERGLRRQPLRLRRPSCWRSRWRRAGSSPTGRTSPTTRATCPRPPRRSRSSGAPTPAACSARSSR